mgnify:CR=1 FL=1|tara:strand:- start:2241 stop:2774 length:534 start_codon:yes stop_codon:yes gene_type:complete
MEFKEVLEHPVPHIRIENVFSEETLEIFNEILSGELIHTTNQAYELYYPVGNYAGKILDTYNKEVFDRRFELAESLGTALPNGTHKQRGTIQGYKGPNTYKKHLDTDKKIMTSVVYLSPQENVGTKFYENGNGDGMYEDPWKVNCGYIFCRSENSWHNYENPQTNIRWVAMYNILNV